MTKPLNQYSKIFNPVYDKILLTKFVIETASNNPDGTYEDLVEAVLKRNDKFTEESLLENACFIVDQIVSYDEAADDDEIVLADTQCIKDLIYLAGVSKCLVTKKQKTVCHLRPIARRDARRAINSDTLTASTPFVHKFFDQMFKDVIEQDDHSDNFNRSTNEKSSQRVSKEKLRIQWIGKIVYEDKFTRRNYYSSVKINDEIVCF